MILKEPLDDKLITMTLMLAVHNNTDIVVASDTKAVVGKRQKVELDHHKIFRVNKSTAILLSGMFHDLPMKQFLTYLIDDINERRITDAETIYRYLGGKANTSLLLPDGDEQVEFIVAGFHNGEPWLRYMTLSSSDKTPKVEIPTTNYEAGGYNECVGRAKELLAAHDTIHATTDELRRVVRTILNQCKKEDARLGGKNDIKILHLPEYE